MSALLEITGLTKHFGGLKAVSDVDLHVDQGEIVSVIGPNGAGKTTCFNLITGYLKPTKGTILFNGKDITGLPTYKITNLGITRTFQNIRIFGSMSVRENVIVGAHCRLKAGWLQDILRPPQTVKEERAAREKAQQLLSLFGDELLAVADEPAQVQSYATRRKTEIARALASDPQILLLDEPTAGMNPVETAECMDTIRRLRDRGVTIILIEHKLKVVMSISDRIAVLDYGVKIADGLPQEVRNNHTVIEAYIGRKAAAQG